MEQSMKQNAMDTKQNDNKKQTKINSKSKN